MIDSRTASPRRPRGAERQGAGAHNRGALADWLELGDAALDELERSRCCAHGRAEHAAERSDHSGNATASPGAARPARAGEHDELELSKDLHEAALRCGGDASVRASC
jgi:hypothetical protein